MIHQLGQFLTKVLLHKNAHEYPLARRELETAYKSLIGMAPSFIANVSDEQLVEMFGNDQNAVAPKCYVLGSLMEEEGEILELEGNETESRSLFLRALSLLLTAFNTAKDEAESGHCAKINSLLIRLERDQIPLLVNAKLFRYHELRGSYDKAGDTLLELLESDRAWVDSGLSFYKRLLALPDNELELGGLARDEVLEGIEKLKRK